jgi:hypothetical protein
VILLLWCFPLYHKLHQIGDMDWDWFVSYFYVLRTSILDYGQFPSYNPWMYLGSPLWANPQIGPISHFTPFVLLFGPVIGLKLGLIAHYFLCFEFARLLGRNIFRAPLSAVIAGLLYALNPALNAHIVIGHLCFAAYPLAPLLMLACLRLPTHRWAGCFAGLTAGFMLHLGLHYYAVYILLLGGLLALAVAIRHHAWSMMVRFALLFGLAFCAASAMRLLPILSVMQDFPRQISLPLNTHWETHLRMWFTPSLGPISPWLTIAPPNLPVTFNLSSHEFYAYIGVSVLLMACWSLRSGIRFYHIGTLLSFWMLLGSVHLWHLSRWMAHITPFDSMWVIFRWRVVVIAALSLAAVQAIDHLLLSYGSERRRISYITRILAWSMPIEWLILLWPSWNHYITPVVYPDVSRAAWQMPVTAHLLSAKDSVIPHRSDINSLPRYYPAFRAHIGVAGGYDPLFGYLPRSTARLYTGHPDYRGEYVVDGKAVAPVYWSPNHIRFSALPPGRHLHVNLNFGRGWYLNGNPILTKMRTFEFNHRFKFHIPDSGIIDLSYRPPGLWEGCVISLLCTLILLLWWSLQRRRQLSPSQ